MRANWPAGSVAGIIHVSPGMWRRQDMYGQNIVVSYRHNLTNSIIELPEISDFRGLKYTFANSLDYSLEWWNVDMP